MAKRTYGTGTIKEKNGTFFIGFRPAPGQRQVWEKVGRLAEGTTRKDAEALLDQRRVEARQGLHQRDRFTLEEVADAWWEERCFAKLAPKTRESEKTALENHLLPAFGGDYLHEITPDLLRRFIQKKLTFAPGHPKAPPVEGSRASKRGKPLGTTAVRQQIQTLSKIFEWAIDHGKASSNPCTRVDKKDLVAAESEVEVFEILEVKRLLREAADPELRVILLMLVGCGLRIGEVFALKTTDYVKESRTLHIQRTIRREGGRTVLGDKPKTAASDRYLVLDSAIAAELESQIERVRRIGRDGNSLIFPNAVGKVRSTENFRNRQWKPLLERAQLPASRRLHALRHTFASELIQARKSDTDIAAKMGHKNAQITRVVYAKSFERVRATEAGVIDLYLDSQEAEAA